MAISISKSVLMKNLLLFGLLFLSYLCLSAQTAPDVPVDPATGKVTYTEVVTVEGATQAELFKRAEAWFNEFYTNPTGVIQEKDITQGIKGQHGINIYDEQDGKQIRAGLVKYDIHVLVKDGRYKYEITEIFKHQIPKLFVHEWLNADAPDKEKNHSYLSQVDTFLKGAADKLKATMSKPLGQDTEDDW